MNKKELISMLAVDSDLSKGSAEAVVDSLVMSIQTALKNGEKVMLSGFGSFSVNQKKARKARNPKTGDIVDVPAKWVVKFKPSSNLKEVLNQ